MALPIVTSVFNILAFANYERIINKLIKKNKINENILKYYLNVYNICNRYENVYKNWKESMRPNEEINWKSTLELMGEQVKLMRLKNEKLKQSSNLSLNIPNPRAAKIKTLRLRMIEFDKGVREIHKLQISQKTLFKKIYKAYNSNKKEWYDVEIEYAYMLYFIYVNYLKIYINEINLYILYVKKKINYRKEGETEMDRVEKMVRNEMKKDQ